MLTLDEARGTLGPYREAIFVAPLLSAVKTWHHFVETKPDMAAPLDETARANNIHCWWRTEVRRALEPAVGIKEIASLGFFSVVTSDVLVRFKFVRAGRPSNVSTDRQVLLNHHQYKLDDMSALSLDGVTAPPNPVTCGYALDGAVQVRYIEIRCDYRGQLEWRWPIWGDAAAGGGTLEQLPIPDVPGPVPAVVRSARPQQTPPDGEQAAK